MSTTPSVNYFLHLASNLFIYFLPGFPPISFFVVSTSFSLTLNVRVLRDSVLGIFHLHFPFVISSSLLALNTTYRLMTFKILPPACYIPLNSRLIISLTWMTNEHLKFNMSNLLIISLKPTFTAVFLNSVNVNFILPVAQAKSLRGSYDSLLSLIPTSSLSAVPVGSIFKLHLEFDNVSLLHC